MDMDVETVTKARNTLAAICEAFGVETPEVGAEGNLLAVIAAGRLALNEKTGKVVYKLASPIDMKSAGQLEEIAFEDPAASELEHIHKGIQVEHRGDSTIIDLADMDLMALRVIVKIGGVASGIADRIKGRDLKALSEVFSVLGFFG